MGDIASDEEEDEKEDQSAYLDNAKRSEKRSGATRKDREEALRKMMEDEGELRRPPFENVVPMFLDEDEPMPDKEEAAVDDNATMEVATSQDAEKPQEEPVVSVSGGRRRGRRQVMKKKTVKDEEGYLVTREEAVWESFSEDEAPRRSKPSVFSSSAGAKLGKGASGPTLGKPGNIMSFFSKK